MSGGAGLILIGAVVLVLNLFDRELLIVSWLGSLQVPLAFGAIVLGVVLIGVRRMHGVPLSAMSDLGSGGKPKKGAVPGSPTATSTPNAAAAPVPNVLSGPSAPDTQERP